MGHLLPRGLDDRVIEALRAHAVARGVSLEAEWRDILTRAAVHPRRALGAEFAPVRRLTPLALGPHRLSEDSVREGRDER